MRATVDRAAQMAAQDTLDLWVPSDVLPPPVDGIASDPTHITTIGVNG
jgi:hypothetical protein